MALKPKHRTFRGIGLVEVLITLVVLAVGILGIAKLQTTLVRSGSDTKSRAVGLHLAQEKLEDLRSFSRTLPVEDADGNPISWSAATQKAYSHIQGEINDTETGCSTACEGGTITAGQHTRSDTTYTLMWEVENYCDANPCASTPTYPEYADYKRVRVRVNWSDQAGQQHVTLEGVINPVQPSDTTRVVQDPAPLHDRPKVRHDPGDPPEIVPVDVGDNVNKETTKPLPEVSQTAGSQRVTVDVVTFDTEANEQDCPGGDCIGRREQFISVSCSCQLAGSGQALPASHLVWEAPEENEDGDLVGGELADEVFTRAAEEEVSKPVGCLEGEASCSNPNGLTFVTPGSSQDPLCRRCCWNHHDADISGNVYDPTLASSAYTGGGDHKHYDSDGNLASSDGDVYVEACRFKRVEGLLHLWRDWRLQTVTVVPGAYLTNNLSSYQGYIGNYIDAYIDNTGQVTGVAKPSNTSPTESGVFAENLPQSGSSQLLARGLYIDAVDDSDYFSDLQSLAAAGETVRDKVPFYEFNVTKLANWISGAGGVITQEGMDGGNGSWAVLRGTEPFQGQTIYLSVTDDQIQDEERDHLTEQVGYWVFAKTSGSILNEADDVIGEYGVAPSVGTQLQTVDLQTSYSDPVIVTSYRQPATGDRPAVTRIANIAASSFDVRLQNPGDLHGPTTSDVYYIVMEAGAHTLPGSIPVEAGTVPSDQTNHAGAWDTGLMETVSTTHGYSAPVVLGQVQSSNDTRWSTFWSRSDHSRGDPPDSTPIYMGKHVGEDDDAARVQETLGYILIESGSGTINAVPWEAALGPDSIEGIDNESGGPFSYTVGIELNGSGVDVTNEAIVDESLWENQYSRGLATGQTEGATADVYAYLNVSTSGMIGVPPIDPNDAVMNSGGGLSRTIITVGCVDCVGVSGEFLKGPKGEGEKVNFSHVEMSVSWGGGACIVETQGQSMSYSCEVPTDTSVTVTPSVSPSDHIVCPATLTVSSGDYGVSGVDFTVYKGLSSCP